MKELKDKCKNINRLMVDLLSGESAEVPEKDIAMVEAHAAACSRCRDEYKLIQEMYRTIRETSEAAEREMEQIDWNANAENISLGVRFKHSRRSRAPRFHFSWLLAIPTLTAVFILGIWLGYFLFYNNTRPNPLTADGEPVRVKTTLARLETTLAKREMEVYFQQTQMLLTDLMRQCGEDGTGAWTSGLTRKQARILLNKNRYFSEDLSNPHFLSSRRLLKKLEWLLYEIVTLDENASCDQLQLLQNFIRKERLLLKLRLVGKDIDFQEV
jgi:anti-sigma factor RsiW